jgi:hypothetical protein
MLKQLNIRPEDWYGTRELDWIPKHFTPVPYQVQRSPGTIKWIIENTTGRYAFGYRLRNEQNRLVSEPVLAFENPAETTVFVLTNSSPKYSNLD